MRNAWQGSCRSQVFRPLRTATLVQATAACALGGVFAGAVLGRLGNASEAELPTPGEALLRASVAFEESPAEIQTAQVVGRFASAAQDSRDQQATPLTKGQFVGIYAGGKCRIDFEFETRRVLAGMQKAGGRTAMKLVDQNNRATVLFDGRRAQVYEFAGDRRVVKPVDNLDTACAMASFPFASPFALQNSASELAVLFEPRQRKQIVMAADEGKFLGRFAANAQTEWQLVVDPDAGYRVTKYKILDGDGHPTRHMHMTWKRASGNWYVSRIEKANELRGGLGELLSMHSECTILSFRTNVKVDPKLIQPSAVDEPLEPSLLPANDDAGDE